MDRKIIFFTGKGGVGKTTVSAIVSLYLSRSFDVGVYSFDPAHNLLDVLHSGGQKVLEHRLEAQEVDFEKWKRDYLHRMKQNFKSSYTYLAAYNLLDYFDIFEQAPDADNLGMVLAFDAIISRGGHDVYVFDMPPTAVALEFFRTIRRNRRWVEALIDLRHKIIEKKEIISRIKLGQKQIETDKVMRRLEDLRGFYDRLQDVLNGSSYLVVRNPDRLSHLEADRIKQALAQMQLERVYFVNNRFKQCDQPLSLGDIDTRDIVGRMEEVIKQYAGFFEDVEKLIKG